MRNYITHFLKGRAKLVVLCMVSVFAIVPQVFGQTTPAPYEPAKVYLVQQGPTPGRSGDFWNGLEGTIVDKRPWGGTAADSATGVFYLAVDSKNLYLRAEVKDASPNLRRANQDPTTFWNGTSCEIFFSTRLGNSTGYAKEHSHIAFVVADAGNGAYKVLAQKDNKVLTAEQCQAAVVEWADKSYIIEAAIPHAVAGISGALAAGQAVRCEFRINYAPKGRNRSLIVNWREPGDEGHKNPSKWSDGVLVAK